MHCKEWFINSAKIGKKTKHFMLNYFIENDLVVSFVHSDEEEAEEASEDKDKDSLSSADSSRNPTPKLSSKPARTVDLGAAANYGKLESRHSSITAASSVAQSTVHAGNSDLVDFMSGPSDTSLTSQPFQAPTVPAVPAVPIENDSFFADFASAPAEGGSISGPENFNFHNGMFHELFSNTMNHPRKYCCLKINFTYR